MQLSDAIYYGEFRGTCFGFDIHSDGMFCVGAYAGEDDEILGYHGAGYFPLPEYQEYDDEAEVLYTIDDTL